MVPASVDPYARAVRDPTHQLIPIARAPSRVVAVPARDLDFARAVRDAAHRFPERAALEAALRVGYPRTRVKRNDLSGLDATLYAYRDGRWEPNREG
jgi:hypothetical protein